MTLDVATLRLSFVVVALSTLALFYFVTYRSTRSRYAAWWCVALVLFLAGSSLYLLDGTAQQVWSNPLGSALTVAGACSVWAGARSLRSRRFRPVWFLAAPVVTGVAAAADDPATNVWAGGAIMLGLIALMFGLAARELWMARPTVQDPVRARLVYSRVVVAMSALSGALSLFYVGRTVSFLLSGQQGEVFRVWFGSGITTLITTVLLVAVSFSMTSLSHERETETLRDHAALDGLTGLLNRSEFTRLAEQGWRDGGGARGSLILADLDGFKHVNDTGGHGAGDFALQAFALTCRAAARPTDLVGRYGGDEFIIFLPGTDAGRAQQLAVEISDRLLALMLPNDTTSTTVSYGIASVDHGVSLTEGIELADRALYEAKVTGRDRVVHSDSDRL